MKNTLYPELIGRIGNEKYPPFRGEEKPAQPTTGPKGCDENGPATALLIGHLSVQICYQGLRVNDKRTD